MPKNFTKVIRLHVVFLFILTFNSCGNNDVKESSLKIKTDTNAQVKNTDQKNKPELCSIIAVRDIMMGSN